MTLSTASPTKIIPQIFVNNITTNANKDNVPWMFDTGNTWSTGQPLKAEGEDTLPKAIRLPPGRSCAPSVCSNIAMGIPTFLDLPATTTFFPRVGMPIKHTEGVNEGKNGVYVVLSTIKNYF